ncbi:MAG: hypothetical protein CVT77_03750 [Alphaproteobacteria bacterium HGW-Alphaproteobacteria-16]|nr:MAG: hypothetical protein CVT77_03750 [Alphaproteobacteria bacterium HGW-Alphaproteobacteria-16]
MTERLIVHVSAWRTALLAALSAGFVAVGVWIVWIDNVLFMQVIGWLTILIFAVFAVIGVRQLFRTGPVMEIDSRGILWRRWSDQVIPWRAIRRAETRAVRGQPFLCLWLDTPEAYPSTAMLGRLAGLNRGMGFGDIAITMAGTDQSFQTLIDVVDPHLRRLSKHGGVNATVAPPL